MKTKAEIKKAAQKFVEKWNGKGNEKQDDQSFWFELLQNVFDVKNPTDIVKSQYPVELLHKKFIDLFIPSTRVLIEQKGHNVDLDKKEPQSDKTLMTPYEQALRYENLLPYSQKVRWIVVCNFQEFRIHDREKKVFAPPEIVKLKDLPEQYYRLQFLVDSSNKNVNKQEDVSFDAGNVIGHLYTDILNQFTNPDDEFSLKSLNILCVRLVFCLYAEDAGLFPTKTAFHDYLPRDASQLQHALKDLFHILNVPKGKRDPDDWPAELMNFPYVNGGLFADPEDKPYKIPVLTEKIRKILSEEASEKLDWNKIDPAIFGSLFESTLNPVTRRHGGMHYTSKENIHKVIDPLFLNDLSKEFSDIQQIPSLKKRKIMLMAFQDKLSKLTFLDPACGSGNFLTETYCCLRELENKIIKEIYSDRERFLGGDLSPIKVSIGQFYGIEINDFAVAVARTALWIAENQMMEKTVDIVGRTLNFLPLKAYPNIVEANALRIDWNTVVPNEKLNYIMGNPPFVGARIMNPEQKTDMANVFGDIPFGDLDYVSSWYIKAAQYMQNTEIKTAFVSSNSICQGEQVALLWKPMLQQFNMKINFAHQTFKWSNEAKNNAAVYCVIVGFSKIDVQPKRLFTYETVKSSSQEVPVKRLNPYLFDAPDVFIDNRTCPLCDVPKLLTGSQRIDNDFFMFTEKQKDDFVACEPKAKQYFHPWYGADEFIYKIPRWCLYLGNCSPAELSKMPKCIEIVEKVKQYRQESGREATRKAALSPTHFGLEVFPKTNFLIIPVVSSEKREYVPIGYFSPDCFCSNQVNIIPDAALYHFGILTSSVHMAWMRTVCGRLELRYRYSKGIVYNNFPWPQLSDKQKEKIGKTAQQILDTRNLPQFAQCNYNDLYDSTLMPPELRKAHQANDAAVMEAYGFKKGMTESEIVAELMKMYQELLKKEADSVQKKNKKR